jgi:hypothetical protein
VGDMVLNECSSAMLAEEYILIKQIIADQQQSPLNDHNQALYITLASYFKIESCKLFLAGKS